MGAMANEHPERGATARARARKLAGEARTAIQKARWVVINSEDLRGQASSTRRLSQALRRPK